MATVLFSSFLVLFITLFIINTTSPSSAVDDVGILSCGPVVDGVVAKGSELIPTNYLKNEGNLVHNGGFECGPRLLASNSEEGVFLPRTIDGVAPSTIPPWHIAYSDCVRYIDSKYFKVPSGHAAVELAAGKFCRISQRVVSTRGVDNTVRFRVGEAKNDCHGWFLIDVKLYGRSGPVVQKKLQIKSTGKGEFQTIELKLRPEREKSELIFATGFNRTGLPWNAHICNPVLDEIQFTRPSLD